MSRRHATSRRQATSREIAFEFAFPGFMVPLHLCVENIHLLCLEASPHFGWSWGARVNPLHQQIPPVSWAQTLIRGAVPSTDPIGELGKIVGPRETEC